MHPETSIKKEDTWREALGHYDAGFDSTLRIFEGWWSGRCLARSDGDPNLLNVNRDNDGRWLNAYNDRPDNRWNRDNGFAFAVSQFSSFLPYEGVLFCDLAAPTAKHPADFFYFQGQCYVFAVIDRFRFPENHKEYG